MEIANVAPMGKYRFRIVALVVVGLLALLAYIRLSPILAQDSCLDGGGMWLDAQCIGRRPGG